MPTSKEIIDKLNTKFPKFSRIQMCMIRNPEYGVQMSTAAKRYMVKEFPEMKKEREKPARKRIVIYVDDDMYEEVKQKVEEMMDGLS